MYVLFITETVSFKVTIWIKKYLKVVTYQKTACMAYIQITICGNHPLSDKLNKKHTMCYNIILYQLTESSNQSSCWKHLDQCKK